MRQSFALAFCMFFVASSAFAQDIPKIKKSDPLPANLFIELAKAVNPAVVNISTSSGPKRQRSMGGRPGYRDPFFDLFEQFMGPQSNRPMQGLGTGFIIRDDGLIITNNHVINGADSIKVQIGERDKLTYDATVIGQDERTDVALIKINAKKKLPFVKLGDSKDLEVGEWVAAFGNPFGHGHSLTKGIVSAIGREIGDLNLFPFIQTDASINPGNSGGPMVNTKGEVVGVNTAIDARAQGIGFAIPIDNIKTLLPQLEKEGKIKRGYIGVALQDISEEEAESMNINTSEGALVVHVYEGSPAEKGGIQPADLITEVNGKKIENSGDLTKQVAFLAVGDKATVKVNRKGKKLTLNMKIEEMPDETQLLGARPGRDPKRPGMPAGIKISSAGFKVTEYSKALLAQLDLLPLSEPKPIVLEVERGSPAASAGLEPGDIVLDVNQKSVTKAKDVADNFKKSGLNAVRVLKGERIVALFIRSR